MTKDRRPKTKDLFRFSLQSLVFGLWSLCTGCAGINFNPTPITFEDPVQKLGIQKAEPTETEKAGVVLRQNPVLNGELHYRSETRVFARIENKKGVRLDLVMNQTDRFSAGKSPETYRLKSVTEIEKGGGQILEDKELNSRGEILDFFQGFHHSKIGNFKIVSWTRGPIFPEEAVNIGSHWSYEERTDVRIESWMLKELNPAPYQMKTDCELTAFVLLKGNRAAVVKCATTQDKPQHFKIFFKEISFNTHAAIENTSYIDYASGILLASITNTRSRTEGVNISLQDFGESQTILEKRP